MKREDFPILSREVYGKPLIYLDNAATTQKPLCVIDAISEEYLSVNANVHRGVHFLSQQATELHENARHEVQRFINARSANEIVFTRGTTESLNLMAFSYGEAFLSEGDEVVISEMEHHSNIVPWQMLRDRKGIKLKVIPVTESGELDMEAAKECIGERTKLLSIAHVSNVLGTINPIKELVLLAHERGCHVLIDAAQSVPHIPVDVQDLGGDFLAFSGHKIYGPTGIGVLYGREELLEKMPPYQGGGEMIARVTFEKTTYETLPFKFEAGTPDYVGTNALAVALRYVGAIGMDEIHSYESSLTRYAMQRLREIEGLRIYGESAEKDAVVSFNLNGIHHLDVGTLLDRLGIAVRTGHHCAQPLMQRYDTEGMVRASFAFYNTKDEIDKLADALLRVKSMF